MSAFARCCGIVGALLGDPSAALTVLQPAEPAYVRQGQVGGAGPEGPVPQRAPLWERKLPATPAEDPEGIMHGTAATDTKYIGHVPLYGYNRVTSGKNKYKHWLVSFPPHFRTDQLGTFCSGLLASAKCTFMGHPSENGLAFVHVEAEEYEMGMRVVQFPGADYVEADGPMHMLKHRLPPGLASFTRPYVPSSSGGAASSPTPGTPWGLDRIDDRKGLDGTYEDGAGGAGVHIYIMDTGIDTTHPDFGGRAVPAIESVGGIVKECDRLNTSCAWDDVGHGTHTAGTVGSNSYGAARRARLHAVKVLNSKGGGAFSWLVTSIDWVLTRGLRPAIITASLGGDGKLKIVKDAIDKATGQGVSVVVAAGNEGNDACHYTPSYVEAAMVVGSVDDDDSMSPFSNYGPCVDIFAPGTDIESLSPGSALSTMSGTSMAAPFVAGGLALTFSEMSAKRVNSEQVLLGHATRGALKGMDQNGSPNRLLFTGKLGLAHSASAAPGRGAGGNSRQMGGPRGGRGGGEAAYGPLAGPGRGFGGVQQAYAPQGGWFGGVQQAYGPQAGQGGNAWWVPPNMGRAWGPRFGGRWQN